MLDQLNKALAYLEKALPVVAASTKKLDQLDPLIGRMAETRALCDRISDVGKLAGAISDNLSNELVPAAMQRAKLLVATHQLGRVQIAHHVSATIIDKENKGPAYAWLDRNDYGAIIIQTVPAQSLTAVAKELLESGKELPPTLFKTNTRTYAKWTPVGAAKKRA